MKNGKLESHLLDKMLKKYRGYEREDVRLAGKMGEDCTFIDMGKNTLVLSTDPITAAETSIGSLAFNINMNDLATTGAEGIGVLVTILLPSETSYDSLDMIMGEIHEECLKHRMQILGGHTEVTDAVNRIIVSISIVGKTKKGEEILSSGLKVGDRLYVSKILAIEGSLIILNDFKKFTSFIKEERLKEIKNYFERSLSVAKEGEIGARVRVNSMHDITEGGVLGALYEVTVGSNKGCIVYEDKFPFIKETLEITEKLSLDPLRLISSGSMLIGTDKGEELEEAFKKEGIPLHYIGEVTEGDLILVKRDGKKVKINPPQRDEIYRLFEGRKNNEDK